LSSAAGKTTNENRVYLHRGIAARQFQRSFVLAEGIEVHGAWLDNGLLHIDLMRRRSRAVCERSRSRIRRRSRPGRADANDSNLGAVHRK